ncbi:hypothetical protein OQZ55_11915 [Bacillus subtilis]|uniref:hypothetical protein n=1 Tax=Bacillus subtilis TaxID=1423 RepID=UPI00132EC1E7|nr:hypothetical protein [Bacillus subtilis]MCT6513226.1 hypothetical protein [Bacillus subtilis]MCX4076901.1 hypothetical protein [Bacillus subtilis]MEC0435393.1 hypothetical protein [Bacillus subtilis]QHF58088.1 hypothetical protein Bateq7PJ16_2282 [Bacillus subtilis]WRU03924.1 hypothetical protein VDS58_11750 [Bacillus subtilis]
MLISEYLKIINGASFVEKWKVNDDVVFIEYFSSYRHYKDINKGSNITEEDFENYFNTGDKILKIVIGEPARIFREFSSVSAVIIKLQEISYYITRASLDSLTNLNISDLSTEDESWRNFANEHIYNKLNRQKLYSQINNFTSDLHLRISHNNLTLDQSLQVLNRKIEKGEARILNNGTIEFSTPGTFDEPDKKKSKYSLFFIQGVLRAAGEFLTKKVLDGSLLESIKDLFE